MAKRTIVNLIDDLDGSAATETIRFAYDGVDYTIDLSAKNAEKLRKALKTYAEHGVKVTPFRATRARPAGDETRAERAAIREWARKSGRYPDLGIKGRIPADIVAAYHQAGHIRGRLREVLR